MENLYQSQDRIEELKARENRCKCKFCGSPLEIRRIIFSDDEEARIELFCTSCDRIEYGVEPEIYHCAAYFVDRMQFNHYESLEQNEQTRRMNIAKVCDIMQWPIKAWGFWTKTGSASLCR